MYILYTPMLILLLRTRCLSLKLLKSQYFQHMCTVESLLWFVNKERDMHCKQYTIDQSVRTVAL